MKDLSSAGGSASGADTPKKKPLVADGEADSLFGASALKSKTNLTKGSDIKKSEYEKALAEEKSSRELDVSHFPPNFCLNQLIVFQAKKAQNAAEAEAAALAEIAEQEAAATKKAESVRRKAEQEATVSLKSRQVLIFLGCQS